MPLRTRLTESLNIEHPVILGPMGFVAGGKLAAAVTQAGGLGIIGGGYGDGEWLEAQFRAAGNASIGCGFITWSLARKPELLDRVLAHEPKAVILSFGDPAPFAAKIAAAGALLMCQVQRLDDAMAALDAGAAVIIAQGAEAGGHSERRATMTLVPEVADLLAARSPDTLLCAAGGIADGRGLAAALMLGADGVVVGTRFWAAEEALVHPSSHAAGVKARGDDTVRTRVVDIVRGYDEWPDRFDIRVLRNTLVDRWHGREEALRGAQASEMERHQRAVEAGDADNFAVILGESIGLIDAVEPAGDILRRMVGEAETLMRGAPAHARD